MQASVHVHVHTITLNVHTKVELGITHGQHRKKECKI